VIRVTFLETGDPLAPLPHELLAQLTTLLSEGDEDAV